MQAPVLVSPLSRRRIIAAFAVAIMIDALQIALGPLGWFAADQGLDVLAMIVTTALLGFHPLLLPSFILELLPVADMLPTWTACVGLVVMLKRKHARIGGPP